MIKLDKCKWLPDIIECKEYSKWNEYLDELYKVFQKDFVEERIKIPKESPKIKKNKKQNKNH